jgi:uncharacterized protein YggL (DUF469 family)
MPEDKMKRRIRKKLYLGEFAILGFEFSCSIDDMDENKVNDFFADLLTFLASNNMLFSGGGTKDNFGGYITSRQRYGCATDEGRKALETWLTAQAGVTDAQVAELSDAIYGYNEE